MIANVKSSTLQSFVNEAVSNKVSLLNGLVIRDYPHATVDHAKRQHVVGAVHTQTIEGFWSIFKRGIVGSFHKVSAKYLPLYIAEFQFRYNNHFNDDVFGTRLRVARHEGARKINGR
jgi:hypothetical protein